jgi:hypothetical protein
MIGGKIIHIGIGDTGEGMIRVAFTANLINTHKIRFIDTRAHMNLEHARELSKAPAFTFVRNPWDWYISLYIHRLRNRRWKGSFQDWFYNRDELTFQQTFDYFCNIDGELGIDLGNIGKFETFKEDVIRIIPKLIPDIVSTADAQAWFPSIYRQWSNRPWIEGIEQHLRGELYNEHMNQKVMLQDAWIISTFGYSFYDVYDFDDAHT